LIIPPSGEVRYSGAVLNGRTPARRAEARKGFRKRVFEIDADQCPRCGGTLKIIAAIEHPPGILLPCPRLGSARWQCRTISWSSSRAWFTLAGLLVAVVQRHRIVALCGIPVLYMVPPALTLASIDRYAFPAYAIVLATLVIVPTLVGRDSYTARAPPPDRSRTSDPTMAD
jgi:hypothetical protein